MRVTSPLMSLSPVCLSPSSLPLSLHSSPFSFCLSLLSLSPLFPAPLFPASLSPLFFLQLSLPCLSLSSLPLSLHPSPYLSSLSLLSRSPSLLSLSPVSFFPVSLRAPSLPPRSPHVPALCLPPSVAISSFTPSLSLIILLCLFLIFTLLIPLQRYKQYKHLNLPQNQILSTQHAKAATN